MSQTRICETVFVQWLRRPAFWLPHISTTRQKKVREFELFKQNASLMYEFATKGFEIVF
jgi:hypothetical protein